MKHQREHIDGFITLLVAILVTAFGVALVSTLLLLGGGAAQSTTVLESSMEARGFASACVETALLHIRKGVSYAGSDTLTFGGGNCDYSVVAGDTESVVHGTGTAGDAVHKILATAETSLHVDETGTTTTITSLRWSEVADF